MNGSNMVEIRATRDWLILTKKTAMIDITVGDVLKAVSAVTWIPVETLRSHKRDSVTSCARQIAMYLADELTDMGRSHIARQMGNRDHTTVIYGCNRIAEKMKDDHELRGTVNMCRSRIISRY